MKGVPKKEVRKIGDPNARHCTALGKPLFQTLYDIYVSRENKVSKEVTFSLDLNATYWSWLDLAFMYISSQLAMSFLNSASSASVSGSDNFPPPIKSSISTRISSMVLIWGSSNSTNND